MDEKWWLWGRSLIKQNKTENTLAVCTCCGALNMQSLIISLLASSAKIQRCHIWVKPHYWGFCHSLEGNRNFCFMVNPHNSRPLNPHKITLRAFIHTSGRVELQKSSWGSIKKHSRKTVELGSEKHHLCFTKTLHLSWEHWPGNSMCAMWHSILNGIFDVVWGTTRDE